MSLFWYFMTNIDVVWQAGAIPKDMRMLPESAQYGTDTKGGRDEQAVAVRRDLAGQLVDTRE